MPDETGTFGWALAQLRAGLRVMRHGWNGKNMFLELVPAADWDSSVCLDAPRQPFIAMYTAEPTWVPWLASQSDLLAGDWSHFDGC